MASDPIRLFSIAPYRVLPATTGGHHAIVSLHDALGRHCADHLVGVTDNGPADGYAFRLHRFFAPKSRRYLPYYHLGTLTRLAQELQATHLVCEHPYMAVTAGAVAARLGIPWFIRAHNIESRRFRDLGKPWWKLLYYYERRAMRQADGVFFITPEDRDWAVAHYVIDPARAHVVLYGTSLEQAPAPAPEARRLVAQALQLDAGAPWLYFLGVQHYAPNAEATRLIVTELWPRLRAAGLNAPILIGGKGLPEDIQALIRQTDGAVRYIGFIDDLDRFIRACDVMLNPVVSGGGIKTKAVEALAYNKRMVSTETGAAGIIPEACGDNLYLVADDDWDGFAAAVIAAAGRPSDIPPAFYDHYSWDAIARKMIRILAGASGK